MDALILSSDEPVTPVRPEGGSAAPLSPDFKEEKAELEWVLSRPEFSRSASLVRFLSLICTKYFDGEANEIREYTIAVEALGRKESGFDSQTDPIVRVTARSLRKKLAEIYRTEGKDRPIQIVLPLGHYVPMFVRPTDRSVGPEPSPANRPIDPPKAPIAVAVQFPNLNRLAIWKFTAAVAAVAAIFLAGYFLGQRSDRHPQVANEALKWGEPVWSDDFNGGAQRPADPSRWTYDIGNHAGWGNKELEIYCPPQGGDPRECNPQHPNVFQDGDGHLVLRASRAADGAWTSARITTRGLKTFQYGRIEARMKLPVGTGLWPSFWMLGSNFDSVGWPASGSVDIVENVSLTPLTNGTGPTRIRSTVHGPRYFGGNGLWHDFRLPDGERVDDGDFHAYGIIWSPGMIQFYVDDPANVFFVMNASDVPEGGEWVLDHPFFLTMNLAVGGDWPGNPDATTPNPADMLVDYVRVYDIPSVPAPGIQWQPVEVKAGSSEASPVKLHARNNSGHVHLACSTEPATAICSLATSVVNFSDTLSQEDTLTIATDSFTDKGRMVAPPGHYKMTITATTISGDRSQLTVPFEVKNGE
jgi:beta-glucanase (GH16 family)